MLAELTAYQGRIIIELKAKASIKGVLVTSLDNPRIAGHIVKNTAVNLGVSEEALRLLKMFRRDTSLGDCDWSKSENGVTNFGWKGGPCAILNPDTCVVSNKFRLGQYIAIPNNVPEMAKRQLDKLKQFPSLALGLLTGATL